MNLKSLFFFKKVVEAKSISKVSHKSYISQSALSQMIQRLESEIGYQLLERSNKGVSLTEMGKIVYKYSGLISRIYEEMNSELCALSESKRNIKISGYYSFINYSLPCVLYKVKKKHENLNFEVHATSSEEALVDLKNKLTDISFLNIEPTEKNIKYSSIGKEKVVLVAKNSDEFPDEIKINQLKKYELILMNSYSVRKDFLKSNLEKAGIIMDDLNVIFELDTISAAKSSIDNSLGMCFLPYMSIKQELYKEQFKLIEIKDFNLNYDIYLAMSKGCNIQNSINDIYDYFIKNGTKGIC